MALGDVASELHRGRKRPVDRQKRDKRPQDEQRVIYVAETIAAIAERVTAVALEDESLFRQFRLRPEEERLVRLTTGYGPASTASRLDAFLLP